MFPALRSSRKSREHTKPEASSRKYARGELPSSNESRRYPVFSDVVTGFYARSQAHILCSAAWNQAWRAHIIDDRAEDRGEFGEVLVGRGGGLATRAVVGIEINRGRRHCRQCLAGLVTRAPASSIGSYGDAVDMVGQAPA